MSADAVACYDLFDATVASDPYDTYRWLRDEAPVHHSPVTDTYVLSPVGRRHLSAQRPRPPTPWTLAGAHAALYEASPEGSDCESYKLAMGEGADADSRAVQP